MHRMLCYSVHSDLSEKEKVFICRKNENRLNTIILTDLLFHPIQYFIYPFSYNLFLRRSRKKNVTAQKFMYHFLTVNNRKAYRGSEAFPSANIKN